jgi:hypothetical protein
VGKKLGKWERRERGRENYFAAFPLPEVHILRLWNYLLRVMGVVATTRVGAVDYSLLSG